MYLKIERHTEFPTCRVASQMAAAVSLGSIEASSGNLVGTSVGLSGLALLNAFCMFCFVLR